MAECACDCHRGREIKRGHIIVAVGERQEMFPPWNMHYDEGFTIDPMLILRFRSSDAAKFKTSAEIHIPVDSAERFLGDMQAKVPKGTVS